MTDIIKKRVPPPPPPPKGQAGARLNIKLPSYQYRDSHGKEKRSHDRLIFDMGTPFTGKTVFILRWGPGSQQLMCEYCIYYWSSLYLRMPLHQTMRGHQHTQGYLVPRTYQATPEGFIRKLVCCQVDLGSSKMCKWSKLHAPSELICTCSWQNECK